MGEIMNRFLGLALILCAAALSGSAQSSPIIIPPGPEPFHHHVGLIGVIHTEHPEKYRHDGITLQVIVTSQGKVESAHAVEGPAEFFAEAEAIEMNRRFKPFEQDGRPVRVSITDVVVIVPMEEWGAKVPFPQVKDWNSLRFKLNRPPGYCMDCPAYTVEIRGDGTVVFHGEGSVFVRRVHQGDRSLLITGTHRGMISKQDLVTLLNKFRQANYFSLKDKYAMGATDMETVQISVTSDGQTKQVTDYSGLEVGMPEIVRGLEEAIDKTAGTDKWIEETPETWPALVAEHWGFKAQTEENILLVESVVARGSVELIERFLTAGAPTLAVDKRGMGPLVSVAENGDLPLAKRMLAGNEHPPAALLVSALSASARSGNTEMLEFLLGKGADVNGQGGDDEDSETVLMSAVQSGRAEMVRAVLEQHPIIDAKDRNGATALMRSMQLRDREAQTELIVNLLISAGANVNARQNDGQTPLFSACGFEKAVKPLVQAGADVNAQDIGGRTALMLCTRREYLQALVEAGADLTIRNSYGETAAEQFRSESLKEEADFLDGALKARQR